MLSISPLSSDTLLWELPLSAMICEKGRSDIGKLLQVVVKLASGMQ